MTDEETVRKLMNLRLTTMAQAFRDLLTQAPGSQLSFSEQVALMVDREWTDRENRRLARLMRAARLSVSDASLENVWCDPARGIDKATIRDLATGKWIQNKQNVIVVGKTGVGKTFVGAALAQAACRNGMRALCARVPRLLNELGIARADGTYAATLARLAKLDVLVLDDFLIAPPQRPGALARAFGRARGLKLGDDVAEEIRHAGRARLRARAWIETSTSSPQ